METNISSDDKTPFMDDYKTPRCQSLIGRNFFTQCPNPAKHDNDRVCGTHSRAFFDRAEVKRIAREIAKATAFLEGHGYHVEPPRN